MVKARLWFTCAAMHDPVTPVIVRPALIGWDAKRRQVDLQIERGFSGEELVHRMKGWITVDPAAVIKVIKEYGRLRVLDERAVAVEVTSAEDYEKLSRALTDKFGAEVNLERLEGHA
jgi:hypothetical protein